MNQHVPVVLLLLATLASSSPFPGVKCDGLRQKQHNFDLGPLTSCEVPPSNSLVKTWCPNVDYPIPTVVLEDQVFIVAFIRNNLANIDNALIGSDDNARSACRQGFTDELCSFYFPRCSDDHSTVDVSFNCTRAKAQCPSSDPGFDRFCLKVSPHDGVYPIEPCKMKEEQQVSLDACASYVDQALPSWLLVHVKAMEGTAASGHGLLSTKAECAEMFLNYSCRSIGRCWSQGCRLERVNSKEQCNATDACMLDTLGDNNIYDSLSRTLSCGNLPSENGRLSTPITPITPTTAPTQRTTTPTPGTGSDIPVITVSTGASPPSSHSIALLVIFIAIFSCLSLL